MNKTESTLVRARVNASGYRKAERVFKRLGLKPSEAINLFMAQVALRDDLPFTVTTHPDRLQSDETQAGEWNAVYGDY